MSVPRAILPDASRGMASNWERIRIGSACDTSSSPLLKHR